MHPTRIAELLQPFLSPIPNPCHSELGQRPGEEPAALSPSQLNHISTYIDILLHWNSRINLTAIRNEEEIVTPHFGESLFASRHFFPQVYPPPPLPPLPSVPPVVKASAASGNRVPHRGSGAAPPALPKNRWAPKTPLTLTEPHQKKPPSPREPPPPLTLTDIDKKTPPPEPLPPRTFD